MIKSISRALVPRVPTASSWILFMEYPKRICSTQRCYNNTPHDTRSTSAIVRDRKREPEEERRGECFLVRATIMRANTCLCVCFAPRFMSTALPFSPYRNAGNAPLRHSATVYNALSLMNRLWSLITFHISLAHRWRPVSIFQIQIIKHHFNSLWIQCNLKIYFLHRTVGWLFIWNARIEIID